MGPAPSPPHTSEARPLPFVKGGAQLGPIRAFGDNPHPDLVLVDDVWVLQADWKGAGGSGGRQGCPREVLTPSTQATTPGPGRVALHLHLQGEGGHRGQRAAGEEERAHALADQLTHAAAGAEAPVAEHLPCWTSMTLHSVTQGRPMTTTHKSSTSSC